MKKKILFVFLLGILLCMLGCTDTRQRDQQEGTEMLELTQEKKDFLADISMDEERVREGKLFEWQKEVLRQYDYAMEYLQRKYPSYTFSFNSCKPKGRDAKWSTFWFQADGFVKNYDLYLYVDADGGYSCEDNFYQEILESSYNEKILSLLQKEIPECFRVVSSFDSVVDENISEKTTGEDVLNGNYELSNHVDIYVLASDESQASLLAKRVEDVIKEKKIYGSYYIEVLKDDPGNACDEQDLYTYVHDNSNQLLILEKKFNQFNE